MKIEGSYRINAPQLKVWQMITNPEVIERCVPGCESLEIIEDGSFKIQLKAGVGAIKGVFTGMIKLNEIRSPDHYVMIVDAKGSSGFVKGEGALDLREEDEETIINYAGEINIGGTLASVGQRMIQSAARMMTSQFFTSIEAEVKALTKAEETHEPFTPPKHGLIRNTIRQIKK